MAPSVRACCKASTTPGLSEWIVPVSQDRPRTSASLKLLDIMTQRRLNAWVVSTRWNLLSIPRNLAADARGRRHRLDRVRAKPGYRVFHADVRFEHARGQPGRGHRAGSVAPGLSGSGSR